MQFQYKAGDSSGKTVEGVLEATDLKAAVEQLRSMKLTIIDVSEYRPSGLEGILSRFKIFKKKIKSRDIVIFSRQLSTLVSAGVPIVQGLSILEQQAENPKMKLVLGYLRSDIESGKGVSEAMKKHPEVFSNLYVSMVNAGEVGGILDTILERLSGYLENAEQLKAKVKSALMYPLIVTIIAFMVTVFLLIFVIPTFKNIFESFGAQLPLPTQMLLKFSDFMRSQAIIVLLFPFALVYAIKKYYHSPKGRQKIDTMSLNTPVFGMLLTKVAISKFSRTLGTLLKSGVPILQSLETVATTSGNVVVEQEILKCRDAIKEGGRMAEPLKATKVFPPMVTQMIAVGEESGSLDQMLVKIADFYDGEVDAAVKGLTSMIEPIIIVFMGIVIGTIVIVMLLPMFELGELASNMG
jgi:type IV pilus assembly protein PilC